MWKDDIDCVMKIKIMGAIEYKKDRLKKATLTLDKTFILLYYNFKENPLNLRT